MLQTFRNAWKIPELKNRLLFTLAILVVYRLGCAIPVSYTHLMQITDPIADLLTRIRNASCAKHPSVEIPASNMKKAICQILVDEGYILSLIHISDKLIISVGAAKKLEEVLG